jgi:hypothetical protein
MKTRIETAKKAQRLPEVGEAFSVKTSSEQWHRVEDGGNARSDQIRGACFRTGKLTWFTIEQETFTLLKPKRVDGDEIVFEEVQ